jgi:hypothetical protein
MGDPPTKAGMRYYAFNKEWDYQVAWIKVWAPEEGTVWAMLMYCPDSGAVDAQDNIIENTMDANGKYTVDFPGWIGSSAVITNLSEEQKKEIAAGKERGRVGLPRQVQGTDTPEKLYLKDSSYKGLTWPNKNKFQEYTTGGGMFDQDGHPLNNVGKPITERYGRYKKEENSTPPTP